MLLRNASFNYRCVYPEEKCFCAECSRGKGERSQEAFAKVHIPDYSKLFGTNIWTEALPSFLRKGVAP